MTSLILFLLIAHPVKLLIAVGTLNGFILPIALAVMLWATYKTKINYTHPWLLTVFGIAVAVATAAMSIYTLTQ